MDCFNGRLSRLREEYDSFVKEPLPELTKEAFDCFYETGSRKEYEALYFRRRNVLLGGGCGHILGLFYAANPRLCLYSTGLI